MNPTDSAVAEWRGRNAVGVNGDTLGTVEQIYMDTETGSPSGLRSRLAWSDRR
jgi:sporulation protein YlmC with PRC-barrel domain